MGVVDDQTLAVDSSPLAEALYSELAEGDRVGRYLIVSKIGGGGMGVVYLAYDPELHRRVAVKLVRPDAKHGIEQLRLQREAQALAKLAHPNVITVFDVGVLGAEIYLAMEYIEGDTLAEWSKRKPSWREVVAVFVQIARGLSAAHAVGLLHRDVKPANILISEAAGVRLVDFGLAVPVGDVAAESTPEVPGGALRSGETGDLSVPLTEAGTVMGTPAYMAPESFDGEFDERSDQYGFFVTLWEALYQERPFRGTKPADLRKAKTRMMLSEPPGSSEVPRWLKTMVVRGLDPDPAHRWPSMAGVAEHLARTPGRRRGRYMLASGVLAVGVGAATIGVSSDDPAELCAATGDLAAAVWSPKARADLEAAIVRSEVAYAPDTYQRVAAGIDAYVLDWTEMRAEACEATRVHAQQSDAMLDLRNGCLDRKLQGLESLVLVLGQAEVGTVEKAAQAVDGLPSLAACQDLDALRATVDPPSDPDAASKVEALRSRLRAAAAQRLSGGYAVSLGIAQAVQEETEPLGYAPLDADARLEVGSSQRQLGQYAEAADTLAEAYWAALESKHGPTAMEAALQLVRVVGFDVGRHEEGLAWGRHAQAIRGAYGATPQQHTRLLHARGAVEMSAGRIDEARASMLAALALVDDGELGSGLRSSVLTGLGSIERRAGNASQALQHQRAALAELERVVGPNHPRVGALLLNLGNAEADQRNFEAAKDAYERTRKIWEPVYDPNHPNLGLLHAVTAALASDQGDYESAREQYARALEIQKASLGPMHSAVGMTYSNLGNSYLGLGDVGQAVDAFRQAVVIREEALGDKHALLGLTLSSLGEALVQQGESDEAVAVLDRALLIYEGQELDSAHTGRAHLHLAHALWSRLDQRVRACDLAKLALVELGASASAGPDDLRTAGEWAEERCD